MNGGTDPNEGTGVFANANAITEALTRLVNLGRQDVINNILDEVENNAPDYSKITDDPMRSDLAKLQDVAKRYIHVLSTLAAKLTAAANSARTDDSDDAARVFGIKGLPGDIASLAISLRDARDRVATTMDRRQLQMILSDAVRFGDEPMVHAAVERAFALRDVDTINVFIAAKPALEAATERLWAMQSQATDRIDALTKMRVNALKPKALANRQDYEIEKIAAGGAAG